MKSLIMVIGISTGVCSMGLCQFSESTLDPARLELNALCREFRESEEDDLIARLGILVNLAGDGVAN